MSINHERVNSYSCKMFLILLLSFIKSVHPRTISLFESTAPVSDNQVLSGLSLISDNVNVKLSEKPGFSLCARFNFKRLLKGKSMIVRIGTVEDWFLTFLFPGYHASFTAFGNWDENRSAPGWILQEKSADTFMLWSTNQWHHICMSYMTSTSHITYVKVNFIRVIIPVVL